MVQGLSIYRLAPCTEDCSQKISKTFSHNNLESVLLFCTFEPKKCKCAFRVAVSACTLKILCCGYNMATIKKDKKIKDYDTRSCSEMVIFPSLRKKIHYNKIKCYNGFFYYYQLMISDFLIQILIYYTYSQVDILLFHLKLYLIIIIFLQLHKKFLMFYCC